MGLLRWLFGERKATEKAQKIRFDFLIYDEGEKIEPNKWFQKASWKNKNFVGYKGSWNADWKYSDEGKVKIAGLSRGSRSEDFIHLAREEDFKIFLENEPENPVNKNARKVMASATIDGEILTKHVGYLPDEIATKYAGIEIDIRPSKAFIPTTTDLNLGVEVVLLVRSARYLKKQK